jgi:hypothetical protein
MTGEPRGNGSWQASVTLRRGSFVIEVDFNNATNSTIDVSPTATHAFTEIDGVADRNTAGDYTPNNTDCWAVSVPTNTDSLLYLFSNNSDNIDNVAGGGGDVQFATNESDTYYWGAMPYSGQSHSIEGSADKTFTAGSDVPLGVYLFAARVQSTTDGEHFELRNDTDTRRIDIDDNGTSWDISTTSNYQYFIRHGRIDSNDDGNTIRFGIYDDSGSINSSACDELILMPISLMHDSDKIGPQDVAHNKLHPHGVDRILRER